MLGETMQNDDDKKKKRCFSVADGGARRSLRTAFRLFSSHPDAIFLRSPPRLKRLCAPIVFSALLLRRRGRGRARSAPPLRFTIFKKLQSQSHAGTSKPAFASVLFFSNELGGRQSSVAALPKLS